MPSWKKVIISGSDAALNSLDITQDLTVDTNTLHVDSSNNRVGIGTSPGNTLHVYRNATIGGITSPTVANAGFRVQDSSANMYVDGNSFVIDTAGYLTTTGANDFDIGTNLTSRINIKGDGNVGINTTSPSEKLDVNGNASISGSLTVSQGGNITMDGGGTLDTGGGSLNTTGGSIDTNGGNITLGIGALNGTIPGSAVNVDTVTATVKNFVIDHPTPEKEGYKLRHSSLEGPEIGVYFRGKSTSNIIDLPDYWVDLVEEESITVSLTSFGSPCQHYIEDIRDNQVIIGCACGTPTYHFTVYGERKDVEKLVVEYKEEKYL